MYACKIVILSFYVQSLYSPLQNVQCQDVRYDTQSNASLGGRT